MSHHEGKDKGKKPVRNGDERRENQTGEGFRKALAIPRSSAGSQKWRIWWQLRPR
jgi:hypothetical protein